MWERIGVMVRKEFIQAFREPRMRVLLFLPPLIQLVVFGYAVNLDVDQAHIAWMDMDRTPESRELRRRFEGSGRFDVVAVARNEQDVQEALDRGVAQAVVRVLPEFAHDIKRGEPAQVQVLVDGSNSNTAQLVSSYANSVIGEYSSAVRGLPPSVTARTRVWFNPDLYSRNYFVPGVIANIVMIVTMMLTALAIVREKEIGTMEQLMVTPIRPIELMLGKTLPFAVVGMVDVALITTVALVLFRIPLHGSLVLLFFCAALYLMTTLGAGLLLSTISETQQQAMMGNFFFTTPAFMLSGFAFPIRNMPAGVQYLTYLNPLRYFVEIVRGIFLKGAGIEVLWPQMACMAVYGAAMIGLATARFRKKLD